MGVSAAEGVRFFDACEPKASATGSLTLRFRADWSLVESDAGWKLQGDYAVSAASNGDALRRVDRSAFPHDLRAQRVDKLLVARERRRDEDTLRGCRLNRVIVNSQAGIGGQIDDEPGRRGCFGLFGRRNRFARLAAIVV